MDIEVNMPSIGGLWGEIGIFMGLMVLSAFFSAGETAMTGASRARMAALEDDGNKQAELVNKLRERKDSLIGAMLLGNNFINILASAFATSVLLRVFGENGVAIATIGVTFMVLVFAEVMPKTYALMHPDRLALFMARPVAVVVAVFSPVTATVSRIVRITFHILKIDEGVHSAEAQEEELRGAIELFGTTSDVDADAFEQEKGAMLRSILDLANVSVEEIMVHRKNLRMINADAPMNQIVDDVMHSAFTRLPVWKGTPDNIIGVMHAKLLLSEWRKCNGDLEKLDLKNAMFEPWFIPQSTTLFDQLQAFRKRREHFAIMVDEYGALKGVITLEDILEEIVGQIDDEHDIVVTGVYPQPDGAYVVDGKVTIRDLNRDLDWELPDEEYSTVAGLLLYESQRIPAAGQVYTFHGFRFEIMKKLRNQITLVRITPPREDSPAQNAKAYGTEG
jgi:Mg2+/Co2+ transporter CorB